MAALNLGTGTAVRQTAESFLPWGFVVASAAPAIVLADLAYRFADRPQAYSQFVSGSLAWSAHSKQQDFALLFALVGGFLLAFHLLVRISDGLRNRLGVSAASEFHALTVYASLPLALWLGLLLLTQYRSLILVYMATGLVVLTMGLSGAAAMRRCGDDDRVPMIETVGGSLLVVLYATMSGIALTLGLRRLGIVIGIDVLAGRPDGVRTMSHIAAGLALLGLGIVWLSWGIDGQTMRRRLAAALVMAQSLTPWLFLILLPTPWVDGSRVFYGQPVPASAVAAGALIALAYADLYRRAHKTGSIWSRVSPLCLVAILAYLKVPPAATPSIGWDDYHFGENLTPWWSWSVHRLLPFWDFAPARGLVNYVPGAFAFTFFDRTAASIHVAWPLVSTFYLLISVPVIAASIGLLPTFVGLLLMPAANGFSEIDLLLTVAVCLLGRGLDRWSSSTWGGVWVTVAGLAILLAPGQGGLLILATSPLALISFGRAWRVERAALLRAMIAGAIGASAIATFTPLGRMFVGALRYGAEQSAINTIAHGIAWSASQEVLFANRFVWEAIRASWLAVAAVAGVALLLSWRGPAPRRTAVFGYTLPIFLLSLLFIFRAAGRIDTTGISRLGYASIWMLALLLPIVVVTAFGRRDPPEVLFAVVLAGGILSPYLPGTTAPTKLLSRATEVVPAPAAAATGADAGLLSIGSAIALPEHLQRLTTIQRWLGRLLEPDETYLDLTNRNAHYFYFNRPPPIETAAVYNLVHERQQERAVQSLRARPPPLVLASADNLLWDGGSPALRSYLTYRYVVLHYVPVMVEGLLLMVAPSRLDRLPEENRQQATGGEHFRLLDQAFAQASLSLLPVAWGRSSASLEPQLRLVRRLADASTRHGVIAFDLGRTGVSGRDAGMLAFDFACAGSAATTLKVSWDGAAEEGSVQFDARDGRLLVPLDASPRWLLARSVSSLTLAVVSDACGRVSVQNVGLWQRRVIDRMPGL